MAFGDGALVLAFPGLENFEDAKNGSMQAVCRAFGALYIWRGAAERTRKTAGPSASSDAEGKFAETDTATARIIDGFDELTDQLRRTLETPDDESVAAAHAIEGRGKLRPVLTGTGRRIPEEPFTSRR